MVTALNKNSFGGTTKVTCFTCHMGRAIPMRVPVVTGAELPPALGSDYAASLPPPPAVPSIDPREVLDRFFAASGGAAGVQQSPSLVAVGTITQRRPGRDVPAQQVEISSKAPAMELVATRGGQADTLLAYGGTGMWAKAGTAAPRDLRGRTRYLPRVTGYFAKENGMLRRLVYYIDTPFGQYPTQIDYSSVRDVGGRKVPYAWVISQTRNREFTWVMQTVRATAVEDSKFARPPAAAAAR